MAALLALSSGAGCRNRDATLAIAEKDEPLYADGVRLKNQGRYAEALASFLKVIETRGERPSPEAHLDAGVIYLHQLKDPLEACHHFRKYLELQPNSKEAPLVRGKFDEAKREFARTLAARPLEDQSARLESADEHERLRRENAALRAEIETLQRAAPGPVMRSSRGITLDVSRLLNPAPVEAAPPPVIAQAPVSETPIMQAPPRLAPAPLPLPASPMRTHTVRPQESPWSIARQYYGAATNNAKVQALLEANRVAPSDLQPGMVLKIP